MRLKGRRKEGRSCSMNQKAWAWEGGWRSLNSICYAIPVTRSHSWNWNLPLFLQAYCAEMVCYDYHRYCKGSNVTLVLSTQFLPMVETFVNSHGFYISQSGTVQRQAISSSLSQYTHWLYDIIVCFSVPQTTNWHTSCELSRLFGSYQLCTILPWTPCKC